MSETVAVRPIEINSLPEASAEERMAVYCNQTLEALLPDAEYQLVAERLLRRYPKEVYHQPAHGLDVMHTTDWLLEQTGLEELRDEHTRRALLMAAVAHDAGLYSAEAARYETNERYAAGLLWNEAGFVMDSDQLTKATRGILGTIMDAQKQRRDTPEALLLHHADVGYIWSCDEAQFTQYALRFRHEECKHLSWPDFQELEAKFLDAYAINLERDMRVLRLPEGVIQAMVVRVRHNQQYITHPDLEEPVLEDEWPSAARMLQ
ncbi:MAG: hypothetical protein Q4A34_01765 [Candidatus Saccharibacteria bacterium]|nr:hypothetical protein [Candidatus Saccharibacteria bacterium]